MRADRTVNLKPVLAPKGTADKEKVRAVMQPATLPTNVWGAVGVTVRKTRHVWATQGCRGAQHRIVLTSVRRNPPGLGTVPRCRQACLERLGAAFAQDLHADTEIFLRAMGELKTDVTTIQQLLEAPINLVFQDQEELEHEQVKAVEKAKAAEVGKRKRSGKAAATRKSRSRGRAR